MKNLKYIFKSVYRIFVNYIFFFLYGRINLNKATNIKVIKLKNSKIKNKSHKDYNIYIIENGRICTDGVEQVAYISKNSIIKNITYTQIKGKLVSDNKNFVLKRGTPYLKKKFNGNVISLAQGASGNKNYFHWMFDILPKIKITFSYFSPQDIDYFYMPELQSFQKRILTILGIKNFKVINSDKYRHIQADRIIVPEHPWYNKSTIFNQVNDLPMWISKWLKSVFIIKRKSKKKISKIFIDRSESDNKHCQLINNEQIKIFLSQKGFKSIKVGQYDFLDQIALFNNAKIIIGPHGAAFTNLIFCKKNTKVIEIKPKNRPNNYKTISKIHDLRYKQIITPLVAKNKIIDGDIYINPEKLLNYI